MSILEIFLIGIGLAMDAFAVSVCKGLAMTKVNYKTCFELAVFFGVFQALMPLLGYFLGDFFYIYFEKFGGPIAFVMLLFIGGKMLIDGIKERDEEIDISKKDIPIGLVEVLILAIATSIDAFAVGVTFSLLSVNIILAIVIIGITTFFISFGGVFIGNILGGLFRTPARIAGGLILIFIGVRILITSLG